MATTPIPLTGTTLEELRMQLRIILRDLYEERIAGYKVGDVLATDDDDVLGLTLADISGLEKAESGTQLRIKCKVGGGAQITTEGLAMTVDSIGDDTVSTAKIQASAVSQAKLKTSTGEVYSSDMPTVRQNLTLPGGEYGFFPQFKLVNGNVHEMTGSWGGPQLVTASSTSYATLISASITAAGGPYCFYVKQRYVTSSGEVFWVFLLRERETQRVISGWASPDHPCMGNGGKPLLMPHPFPCADLAKHEIVVVNPDVSQIRELQAAATVNDETKPDKSLLQVIVEQYEIDEKGGSPDWPSIPVTVGLPPGTDWMRMRDGADIAPIKKKVSKPDYIITRTLRLK